MKTKTSIRKLGGLLSAFAIIFAVSGMAIAAESTLTGTVGSVRYHTSGHANVSARQTGVFQMNASGCVAYWLSMDDILGLSMLLRAKKDVSSVTVLYDPDAGAPWGDATICRATSITLN
jgi:hypothetical protein